MEKKRKKGLLSCSSTIERSKFPEGLNATEAATSRRTRFKWNTENEFEVGLHGLKDGIVWFNVEKSEFRGLMVAMGKVLKSSVTLFIDFFFFDS